jgi:hypothetical protein
VGRPKINFLTLQPLRCKTWIVNTEMANNGSLVIDAAFHALHTCTRKDILDWLKAGTIATLCCHHYCYSILFFCLIISFMTLFFQFFSSFLFI